MAGRCSDRTMWQLDTLGDSSVWQLVTLDLSLRNGEKTANTHFLYIFSLVP